MKLVTRNFYFISETSKSLSVRSRSLKNIYRVEYFRANVLKRVKGELFSVHCYIDNEVKVVCVRDSDKKKKTRVFNTNP